MDGRTIKCERSFEKASIERSSQVFDSDNYMEIAQRIKGTQCPITTPTVTPTVTPPTGCGPEVLFLVETSDDMLAIGGIEKATEL